MRQPVPEPGHQRQLPHQGQLPPGDVQAELPGLREGAVRVHPVQEGGGGLVDAVVQPLRTLLGNVLLLRAERGQQNVNWLIY